MAQLDVAWPQEPSKLQELKVNFEQQFLRAMQKAKELEKMEETSGCTIKKLSEELKPLLKEHDELTEEFKKRTTSSHDACKLHGDVVPGDIMHDEVVLSYENYFNTAFRNLPKRVKAKMEEKYEVWQMVFDIVQESFQLVKIIIINNIITKLQDVLLCPVTRPLDEVTSDLYKAFYMYIKQGHQLETIKETLLKEHAKSQDASSIEMAACAIKQLDPKHYWVVFCNEVPAEQIAVHDDVKEKTDKTSGWQLFELFNKSRTNQPSSLKKLHKLEKCFLQCIQELENVEKEIGNITAFLQVLERPDATIELQRNVRALQTENKKMRERLQDNVKLLDELQPKDITKNPAKKQALKNWLKIYVKKLLEKLHSDLCDILSCTSDKITIGGNDISVMYQIYGLLLSACDLKKKTPDKENETPSPLLLPSFFIPSDEEIKVSEIIQKQHRSKEDIKEYVIEAIGLSHSMLTLIPPLIVTGCPKKFKEELHNTNPSTWDESTADSGELKYYRPILATVYDSKLCVSVKGLVGNKGRKIVQEATKESHSMQFVSEATMKKDLISKHGEQTSQEKKPTENIRDDNKIGFIFGRQCDEKDESCHKCEKCSSEEFQPIRDSDRKIYCASCKNEILY